jgi:hypothetical protein
MMIASRNTALILLLTSIFVAGCVSTAKVPLQAKSEDSVAKTFLAEPDQGVIYLYRNKQSHAKAVPVPVNVGGFTIGQLTNNTYLRYLVEPGTYLINAPPASGVMADRIYPAEVEIAAGEVAYVQLLIDNPMRFDLIGAKKAQKDIRKRKLSRTYPEGVVTASPATPVVQ